MIAIVEKQAQDKIEWNKRAINLAEHTNDERCHAWLGPIYNNLAQNYIEAEKSRSTGTCAILRLNNQPQDWFCKNSVKSKVLDMRTLTTNVRM